MAQTPLGRGELSIGKDPPLSSLSADETPSSLAEDSQRRDAASETKIASQQEALLWHQRFGHANFSRVQRLLAQPRDELSRRIITPRHQGASNCAAPCCEACQYGKQKRRQPDSRRVTLRETGKLSENITQPGQRVSVDQYISAAPGRLPHTQGKEKKEHKYCGGTMPSSTIGFAAGLLLAPPLHS